MEFKPAAIIRGEKPSVDFHLNWMLHNQCNYSCSYCPDTNHNGNHRWLKLDMVKRFIDKIENHYRKNMGCENLLVSFTGGEPTLWPGFLDLCRYLSEKGIGIGMTTNGSRTIRFWEEISSYFTWIAVSFHPSFADSNAFLENIKCMNSRVAVGIRIMMDEIYWDECIKLSNRLKTELEWYRIEHVAIMDDFDSNARLKKYSDEHVSWLEQNTLQEHYTSNTAKAHKKNNVHFKYDVVWDNQRITPLSAVELINNDLVYFKDWKCHIGLESLFINERGEIWPGTCMVGGKVGHILDDNITFPTKPVTCTKKWCHCSTDVQVTKFSPEYQSKYNDVARSD
jgi:MoaA/NifB/PqqE/SkfB family radical SAM enzyme